MNKIIFDASALIALINDEKGASIVESYLPHAIMSAVNISETAYIMQGHAIPVEKTQKILNSLIDEIIPFDLPQAIQAAQLRQQTKMLGLSFGDRACLSLGLIKRLPVLTADKIWSKQKLKIKVVLIR